MGHISLIQYEQMEMRRAPLLCFQLPDKTALRIPAHERLAEVVYMPLDRLSIGRKHPPIGQRRQQRLELHLVSIDRL